MKLNDQHEQKEPHQTNKIVFLFSQLQSSFLIIF